MAVEPIHKLDHEAAKRVYAWARYVFWAEVESQQYDAHDPAVDEPSVGVTTVLMAQFYSALWVAIEGWRQCPLVDDTVNELLNDEAFAGNVQLLRRFRNGVYHYQPDLLSEKLLGFLREGEHAVTWAFLVHDEFKRIVWELAHPPGVRPELQAEFADAFRGLVGWLPDYIAEAGPDTAARKHREFSELVMKHGSRDTEHAKALLDAAAQFRLVANESSASWTREKRAMIDALKSQKQRPGDEAT